VSADWRELVYQTDKHRKTRVVKTTRSLAEEKVGVRRLAETLDSLIKDAVESGTPIDGVDGVV
jgi:hypothetical protein